MGKLGSSGGPTIKGGKDSYLVGFKELMVNLNREIGLIEGRTMKGLIKAAEVIHEETEHGARTTPVDVGNLWESWFVVTPTGVPAGKSTANFKDNPKRGITVGKMAIDHTEAITECQGMAASMSTKNNPILVFGYSAFYGGYVHEMVGANFVKKRENAKSANPGSHWLEAAIKSKRNTILKVIGENARIKG
jgi:hypothetical protein